MNQPVQNGDKPDFRQAQTLLQIARLPEIYEKITLDPSKKTEAELRKEAADAVLLNAPSNISRDGIFILQRDNITAIVVHDPKTNAATITFDPTYTRGNYFNNPDIKDNGDVKPSAHTLGGRVHGGFYDKLAENPLSGKTLIERIEGVLHDLASRDPSKPLTVNFTGFSKGGAQAMLAAGEIIADGSFDKGNNIRLGNLYAFSPPGYATPEYAQALDKKVKELGGKHWTIEIHGDTTPMLLTPDSTSYFTRHGFGHTGQRAYIMPSGTSDPVIMLNPAPDLLKALRTQQGTAEERHTIDYQSGVISALAAKEAPQVEPTAPGAPAPAQILRPRN